MTTEKVIFDTYRLQNTNDLINNSDACRFGNRLYFQLANKLNHLLIEMDLDIYSLLNGVYGSNIKIDVDYYFCLVHISEPFTTIAINGIILSKYDLDTIDEIILEFKSEDVFLDIPSIKIFSLDSETSYYKDILLQKELGNKSLSSEEQPILDDTFINCNDGEGGASNNNSTKDNIGIGTYVSKNIHTRVGSEKDSQVPNKHHLKIDPSCKNYKPKALDKLEKLKYYDEIIKRNIYQSENDSNIRKKYIPLKNKNYNIDLHTKYLVEIVGDLKRIYGENTKNSILKLLASV